MSTEPKSQYAADLDCMKSIDDIIHKLRDAKPDEKDKGELARRYAITITEMEKIAAYFYAFVVNDLFV